MSTKETIETYMAAWNETDEAKIRSLLEKCWADDGTYTDPMSDVKGRDALVATITGLHTAVPGISLAPTGAFDEHHGRIRFGWKVAGGAPERLAAFPETALAGIDVGVLAADGRLQSITGFWGVNPPAG